MLPNEFLQWLTSPPADRRPLVMGILNVTPDSFSDGGQFLDAHRAVDHALRMASDGANLIDIGGESTRPGSFPIDDDEQIRRVVPVIEAIRRQLDIAISIDTTRSRVAAAAIDAGALIINDVSAGRDDDAMLSLAGAPNVAIILMHRKGTSRTMQDDPRYEDVVAEVCSFLVERRDAAMAAGVTIGNILLDPGIGFGKTTQHDLDLLRAIPRLKATGQPIVIGASRKKFIGQLSGEGDPARRVFGTAAAVAWSVANGADIVRVHDVAQMVQTVSIAREFRGTVADEGGSSEKISI